MRQRAGEYPGNDVVQRPVNGRAMISQISARPFSFRLGLVAQDWNCEQSFQNGSKAQIARPLPSSAYFERL